MNKKVRSKKNRRAKKSKMVRSKKNSRPKKRAMVKHRHTLHKTVKRKNINRRNTLRKTLKRKYTLRNFGGASEASNSVEAGNTALRRLQYQNQVKEAQETGGVEDQLNMRLLDSIVLPDWR